MAAWRPSVEPSRQEQLLLKRLGRTRKLFGFLRRHRHRLLNEAFQKELAGMYSDSKAGSPQIEPARLCLAILLQAYLGVSDAEAVEMTVVDLRWQMVLDALGATKPVFSQ
ncbi:MAG: transposase, partial [Myxococcota bacterium]